MAADAPASSGCCQLGVLDPNIRPFHQGMTTCELQHQGGQHPHCLSLYLTPPSLIPLPALCGHSLSLRTSSLPPSCLSLSAPPLCPFLPPGSGVDLLRNPKYNKGLSFTPEERDHLYLHGLLPAGYMSQDQQVRGGRGRGRSTREGGPEAGRWSLRTARVGR